MPVGSCVLQSFMAKNWKDRVGELERQLKQRDARIMELTEERDKERKLNEEARKDSNQWHAAFDAWKKRIFG
jgi:hypothetical protein